MRTVHRIVTTSIAVLAAGTLGGVGLANAAGGARLHLADTSVQQGQKVAVDAKCGGEGLNLVGSEAFRPTGEDGPFTGNGGTAQITSQQDGVYHGYAVISGKAKPGKYFVTQRCGGSNAGGDWIVVK